MLINIFDDMANWALLLKNFKARISLIFEPTNEGFSNPRNFRNNDHCNAYREL